MTSVFANTQEAIPEIISLLNQGKRLKDAFQLVAKKTGFDFAALKSAYYRHHPPGPKSHLNQTLTDEEELLLSTLIIYYSEQDLGWTHTQIQEAVLEAFHKPVSQSYISRLMKEHHNEFSLRLTTASTKDREVTDVERKVSRLVTGIGAVFEKKKYGPKQKMTYDEMRAWISKDGKLRIKRMESKRKKKPNIKQNVPKQACTLLPFVTGDGKVFCIFVILASSVDKSGNRSANVTVPLDHFYDLRENFIVKFYFTDTSYVDFATFGLIMDYVMELWKNLHPKLDLWIIGDGLDIHKQKEKIKAGLLDGIQWWFFVEGQSLDEAPLDNGIFANEKKNVYEMMNKILYAKEIDQSVGIVSLVGVILKAAKRAFSPEIIKGAFASTGIEPFQPEIAMTRALKKYQISEETLAQRAASLIPQLNNRFIEDAKKEMMPVRQGQIEVEKEKQYDPRGLINYLEEKEKKKEREKKEKEEKKRRREQEREFKRQEKKLKTEQKELEKVKKEKQKKELDDKKRFEKEIRTCRADQESCYRTGNGWYGCEKCWQFLICPSCSKDERKRRMVETHEKKCRGPETF